MYVYMHCKLLLSFEQLWVICEHNLQAHKEIIYIKTFWQLHFMFLNMVLYFYGTKYKCNKKLEPNIIQFIIFVVWIIKQSQNQDNLNSISRKKNFILFFCVPFFLHSYQRFSSFYLYDRTYFFRLKFKIRAYHDVQCFISTRSWYFWIYSFLFSFTFFIFHKVITIKKPQQHRPSPTTKVEETENKKKTFLKVPP